MKSTQTTPLQPGSMTAPREADLVSTTHDRPANGKAIIGSGGMVTPAIAVHVRKKMADSDLGTPKTGQYSS